jgi:hypothetical protein
VARSVTSNCSPSGVNDTWAGAVPAPLSARVEPASGASEDLFEPDGGELTDPPTGDEYDSEPSAEGQAAFDLGDARPGLAVAVELQPPPPEGGVALSKFRVQPGSEAAAAAPGAAADPAARAHRPEARLLGQRIRERLDYIADGWAQLTFYLTDPDSWR